MVTISIAVVVYVVAILLANISVAIFGPAISPINAFLFIGLDLALRDWLHMRLRAWQMFCIIAIAGVLSYVFNPAAGIIAVASSISFAVSALADWVTFMRLRGSWLARSNASNVVGSAVDSLIFPTLAFGALIPHIVVLQFIAKVVGGALWAWVLSRRLRDMGDAP